MGSPTILSDWFQGSPVKWSVLGESESFSWEFGNFVRANCSCLDELDMKRNGNNHTVVHLKTIDCAGEGED